MTLLRGVDEKKAELPDDTVSIIMFGRRVNLRLSAVQFARRLITPQGLNVVIYRDEPEVMDKGTVISDPESVKLLCDRLKLHSLAQPAHGRQSYRSSGDGRKRE